MKRWPVIVGQFDPREGLLEERRQQQRLPSWWYPALGTLVHSLFEIASDLGKKRLGDFDYQIRVDVAFDMFVECEPE